MGNNLPLLFYVLILLYGVVEIVFFVILPLRREEKRKKADREKAKVEGKNLYTIHYEKKEEGVYQNDLYYVVKASIYHCEKIYAMNKAEALGILGKLSYGEEITSICEENLKTGSTQYY